MKNPMRTSLNHFSTNTYNTMEVNTMNMNETTITIDLKTLEPYELVAFGRIAIAMKMAQAASFLKDLGNYAIAEAMVDHVNTLWESALDTVFKGVDGYFDDTHDNDDSDDDSEDDDDGHFYCPCCDCCADCDEDCDEEDDEDDPRIAYDRPRHPMFNSNFPFHS